MPPIPQILEYLKELYHLLEQIIVVLFILVGLWVAVRHLKELIIDYSERLRDKEHRYRVRTTMVKDLLGAAETQTAKLRRLRVSRSTNKLILDPWPSIVPPNSEEERPAKLLQFYSVPGRLGTQEEIEEHSNRPEKKFRLNLSRDEELKAHREYSTLLVYTLAEKLDDILTPPGFIAVQPVGEECFTYEIHFPPDHKFVRDKSIDDSHGKDSPKVKIFKDQPEAKHELRFEPYHRGKTNFFLWGWTRFINRFRTRYHVTGGRTDFGDRLGKHDWFRVTILRPPRDKDIHICWCMEGDPLDWSWCSHTADDHKKT